MYWVEICNDCEYSAGGVSHKIEVDLISRDDVLTISGSKTENSERYLHLFSAVTEHGGFEWEVEIIEYLSPSGATMLGYSTTAHPEQVLLKEGVMFQLQDGWPAN
jgi:hypothetical protein